MLCFHSNLSQRISPLSELELCALSVPGLLDALEPSAVGEFFFSKFLFLRVPLRHGCRVVNGSAMAAREHPKTIHE